MLRDTGLHLPALNSKFETTNGANIPILLLPSPQTALLGDWGDNGKPNLLLVHGGRDHARSWDRVAEEFSSDFRIIAPDLRGHGDSSWATGAMYSVPEYVVDLSALIDIVGRSPSIWLGTRSAAPLFSCTPGYIRTESRNSYRSKVTVLLRKVGSPRTFRNVCENGIENVRECETRSSKRYPNLEAAVTRMKGANSHLTDTVARHLTLLGSNWNPDGTLQWKFDNYIRAFPPFGFNLELARELWGRIECPTLLVRGEESWVPTPESSPGVDAIRDRTCLNVPNAGHWVHHDQAEIFIRETKKFLAAALMPIISSEASSVTSGRTTTRGLHKSTSGKVFPGSASGPCRATRVVP